MPNTPTQQPTRLPDDLLERLKPFRIMGSPNQVGIRVSNSLRSVDFKRLGEEVVSGISAARDLTPTDVTDLDRLVQERGLTAKELIQMGRSEFERRTGVGFDSLQEQEITGRGEVGSTIATSGSRIALSELNRFGEGLLPRASQELIGLPQEATPSAPAPNATPTDPNNVNVNNAQPASQNVQDPNQPTGQVYTVQAGDTISKIAERFGVGVNEVTGFRSGDPNQIFPGEQLTIGAKPEGSVIDPNKPPETAIDVRGPDETGGGAGADSSVDVGPSDFETSVRNILKDLGIGQPSSSKSPFNNFVDIYKKLYSDLGLTTIKEQAEKLNSQIEELSVEMAKAEEEVTSNPWLSEADKSNRVQKIRNKFGAKIEAREKRFDLQQGLLTQGGQEARFLAGSALSFVQQEQGLSEDLLFKAIDIAQRQAESEVKGGEITFFTKNIGGVETQFGRDKSGNIVSKTDLGESGTLTGLFSNKEIRQLKGAGIDEELATAIYEELLQNTPLDEVRRILTEANEDPSVLDRFDIALGRPKIGQLNQPKGDESKFRIDLRNAIQGMKEIDDTREEAEKKLKEQYGKDLPSIVVEILNEFY